MSSITSTSPVNIISSLICQVLLIMRSDNHDYRKRNIYNHSATIATHKLHTQTHTHMHTLQTHTQTCTWGEGEGEGGGGPEGKEKHQGRFIQSQVQEWLAKSDPHLLDYYTYWL